MEDKLETENHTSDIDVLYESPKTKLKEKVFEDSESLRILKINYRLFRKRFFKLFRLKKDKNFKTILIITLNKPPLDFISAFRKQYPDKKIKVLIPIKNHEGYEKLNFDFEYFVQNQSRNASIYKLNDNKEHIQVYGLYSEIFSNLDESALPFLAAFTKAARTVVKKLQPEIVQADNIPFFLGAELEKSSYYRSKVLQIINDFSAYENNKAEPFWTAINIADKREMKKICKDKIIQKGIAYLFKIHKTQKPKQVSECLEFIYNNYSDFRKKIDKNENIDENIIFKKLNARILKILPQMAYEDDFEYNTMFYSLKRAHSWAVVSQSYYNNLFLHPELSGKIFDRITKTKNKSNWIPYGQPEIEGKIYKPFDLENFREYRPRNKRYLIREFSKARIKTNFIDTRFFSNPDYKIRGYLDSFYEAPLIFCKFSNSIFKDGADIALTIMLKLFDLYKNVQFILNIPQGLENERICALINFLEQKADADGRWILIDGEINLPQFYASADMALFPARENATSCEHYMAMKYGCIPIASKNGIYNDTIADIFDDITCGRGFKSDISVLNEEECFTNYYTTVSKALDLYTNNSTGWNPIIKNAMQYDSTWNFERIEKFNEIYDKM